MLPGEDLFGAVEQALRGGAILIQYRDKSANTGQRERRASGLKALCDRYGIPLIVNDDVDLARELGTGVHLGRDDGAVQAARGALGPAAIVGVSCYNEIDRVEAAAAQGASYVALGRFFPSRTKPGETYADVTLITQIKQRFSMPVAAIGGITADNAGQLITAGADLLAVIHGVFAGKDVRTAATRFADLFKQETE